MAVEPKLPVTSPTFDLNEFTAASVIGRGAKGVVFLVRRRSSGETLALKAISRASLEHKKPLDERSGNAYRRIWFERDVLLELRHPLLPSLRGVVSTDNIVGFAIDYCPGGDLNALRRRQTEKMFSDEVIRFYAAELVIALEYLHGLLIVYRDLKPENVMIQENGHIMLVDFDLATKLAYHQSPPETLIRRQETPRTNQKRKDKKNRSPFRCFSGISDVSPETPDAGHTPRPPESPAPKRSNSFVGTEDYVSPEIIEGNGHDFAVDWWCLGVVLYEMLYGKTPFRGQNRKETFYRILSKPPELFGEPTALRDLIGRLLEKDPTKRITGKEIRHHEFFRGVRWETVVDLERPPFIPEAVPVWEEVGEGIDVEKVVEEIFVDAHGLKGKSRSVDNGT